MNYYQQIELYEPIVSAFFPEFLRAKVYRLTVISELQDNDVGLLCQARDMSEMFEEAITEELEGKAEIITSHNERYFPRPKDFQADDDRSVLMGNSIFYRDVPDYQPEDFRVSDTTVLMDKEIVAVFGTLTLNEPPSFSTAIITH